MHDVPGDNQCLFHALLHALEAQVGDPRAREYTALTLSSISFVILSFKTGRAGDEPPKPKPRPWPQPPKPSCRPTYSKRTPPT